MSDTEFVIKRIAPMKPVKKPPSSPTEGLLETHDKKTTKAMIYEALKELQSRKGVSVQAIKKYMKDKYYVETDKVKYLIKKTLKNGVDDGSIVQLKGIGLSGSFKLANIKEKPKKKPKPKKENPEKEKTAKDKSKEKRTKTKEEKIVKEKAIIDKIKPTKRVKMDVKDKLEVKDKEKRTEKPKDKKKADLKEKKRKQSASTPAKKRTMMKRKSIGSIIKAPKMKPKLKA